MLETQVRLAAFIWHIAIRGLKFQTRCIDAILKRVVLKRYRAISVYQHRKIKKFEIGNRESQDESEEGKVHNAVNKNGFLKRKWKPICLFIFEQTILVAIAASILVYTSLGYVVLHRAFMPPEKYSLGLDFTPINRWEQILEC